MVIIAFKSMIISFSYGKVLEITNLIHYEDNVLCVCHKQLLAIFFRDPVIHINNDVSAYLTCRQWFVR